jgi:lipoprotein-releasing system ATP-binding protein
MNTTKDESILLDIQSINLNFGQREILKDVNIEIKPGTITVITGKSGSGKTTLLGIISGLLKPNSGRVLYRGKNILKWGDIRKSFFRNRKIGFVFQFFNLLPNYTAYENILLPAAFNPFAKKSGERAREFIQYLGLENIKNNTPETLSGGERQRIAIARAIINHPDIILADEPTGNLDENSAQDIKDLFMKLKKENNIAFIIVTHDSRIVEVADQHYHLIESKLEKMEIKGKKSSAKKTGTGIKKSVKKSTSKKTTVKKSTAKKSVKKTVKSK